MSIVLDYKYYKNGNLKSISYVIDGTDIKQGISITFYEGYKGK